MREEWIKDKLTTFCDSIVGGGTPSTKVERYWNGDTPWISSADILGVKEIVPRKFVTEEGIDNSATNKVEKDTIIVVTRVGLGKLAIAPYSLCFSQDNQGVKFYDGLVEIKYALYYLSLAVHEFKFSGRGTTINGVTKKQLKDLQFKLAPLPEQRAIVAKIEQLFSELDNGITNLKAAKDKLEIYRQAVLKKAFEGELTKEWRKQNPYSEKDLVELLEYIEDFNANKSGQDIPRRLPPIDLTDLHKLPYGWIWQESHKICSSVRDGTHDTPKYVDEGVPLVTSKNLKGGEIDMDNVDLISESDHEEICRRSAVEENDILYGMIGTIGNPVIVRETNAFSIKNVGLFKKNEVLLIPKYFQYYLSSWVVEHIMRQKELIRGTTQKFVALGGLRVLPVPLPSKKEQEQIIYEIEFRLSVCDNILANIEDGLEKSEALRQSILKQGFEGKLLSEEELEACRKEPDWETAEKLLARIEQSRNERVKNRDKVASKKVSHAE